MTLKDTLCYRDRCHECSNRPVTAVITSAADVLALREQHREEMNCQIVHDLDSSPARMDDNVSAGRGWRNGRIWLDSDWRTVDREADDLRARRNCRRTARARSISLKHSWQRVKPGSW